MSVINRKTKSAINRESYQFSKNLYPMIVEHLSKAVQTDESGVAAENLINQRLESLREKISEVANGGI